jgi:hypothetical protein
MARSLNTIYNDLIASKETDSTLDSLLPNPDNWNTLYTNANFKLLANTIVKNLSVSKVAVWRLFTYIFAYAIWVHEQLFEQSKTEIDNITINRVFGQLPWYVEKAKLFQLGDELVFINNEYYGYEVIDETKQVVTQASATNSDGIIILKLAKGVSGSFEKLATNELTAINLYFKGTQGVQTNDGMAPAGTKLTIISEDPDDMKMHVDVFVDPLVIDENGVLLADGSTKPVEVAVTIYIQELPFNAEFKVSSLTDAIQAVNGVKNVVVKYCDAKFASNPYTNIMNETGRKYIAYAGYINMATNFGLDEYYDYPANTLKTLNYITD